MTSAAYEPLLAHARETALLSTTAALLSWDQEVLLPAGGAEWRSRQLALLARLAHERNTAPQVGEWLAACEADGPLTAAVDSDAAASVRAWRRDYDRATKLPASLVSELAETESLAQQIWAKARAASDFAQFRPWLEKIVHLHQQKAACLSGGAGEAWDALADLFEPGMNAAALVALFRPLRERLVALAQDLRSGKAPRGEFERIEFPEAAQELFVRRVVTAMGFEFSRGRLDRSAHPFCTGLGSDVRLTTRFHKANVLDALGSSMHEGGHGLYEQGLAAEYLGTPLGEAVSLGIHESQSRLWENQVGRSAAFWRWCRPLARQVLGPWVDAFSAAELFRDSNRVEPSLIRVEADEATYNLHVMVRFELELALLRGKLAVNDLPAAWNAKYREYLGLEVPDDRRGCLQDVHWSCGLFGYFPTYTLGNLYAAQLFAAAERELGDLDGAFARGEFQPLREWLRTKIHRHGRRFTPDQLCRNTTGAPLSSQAFLSYLERKLRAVYEL